MRRCRDTLIADQHPHIPFIMQHAFKLLLLGAWALHNVQAAPVTITAPAKMITITAKSWQQTAEAPAAPVAPAAAVATTEASTTESAAPVSSGSSTSTTGSGTLNISKDQFITAWTNGKQHLPDANVSPPTDAQYQAFIGQAESAGGITTPMELAMFLAEIMWESGGLVYKSELACGASGATPNCPGSYQDATGLPGKYYFGRGYIQLSWGANYKAASQALFGDDRLLQDPDQVASNEDYAWAVSFWFWKANVKPALGDSDKFGLATKAINGALECGGYNEKAHKRFLVYSEVLKVFDPSKTPTEAGCYN